MLTRQEVRDLFQRTLAVFGQGDADGTHTISNPTYRNALKALERAIKVEARLRYRGISETDVMTSFFNEDPNVTVYPVVERTYNALKELVEQGGGV